jgi:hypothetical protein
VKVLIGKAVSMFQSLRRFFKMKIKKSICLDQAGIKIQQKLVKKLSRV